MLGVAIGAVLLICAAGVYFGISRQEKGRRSTLGSEDERRGGEARAGDVELAPITGVAAAAEAAIAAAEATNAEDFGSVSHDHPSRAACVDFLGNKAGLDGSDVYDKMLVEAGGAVLVEDLFNSDVISDQFLVKIGLSKVQCRRFRRAVVGEQVGRAATISQNEGDGTKAGMCVGGGSKQAAASSLIASVMPVNAVMIWPGRGSSGGGGMYSTTPGGKSEGKLGLQTAVPYSGKPSSKPSGNGPAESPEAKPESGRPSATTPSEKGEEEEDCTGSCL